MLSISLGTSLTHLQVDFASKSIMMRCGPLSRRRQHHKNTSLCFQDHGWSLSILFHQIHQFFRYVLVLLCLLLLFQTAAPNVRFDLLRNSPKISFYLFPHSKLGYLPFSTLSQSRRTSRTSSTPPHINFAILTCRALNFWGEDVWDSVCIFSKLFIANLDLVMSIGTCLRSTSRQTCFIPHESIVKEKY